MHFIVTTELSKADRATRKIIRSQVMMGKNRGKSHWGKAKRRQASDRPPEQDPAATTWNGSLDEALSVTIPAIVGGSSLSMVEFASEIAPHAFRDVLSFYDLATQALFPLGMVTKFSNRDGTWLDPMKADQAYVHVTIFAAQTFMDRVLGRRYSTTNPEATAHCLKGIKLLRQRLSRGEEQFSDCTIAVVLTLALNALFLGEHDTLRQHMAGLHKMVMLRGGTNAFRGSKLITEILRCDLGMMMQSGCKPIFFNDPQLEPTLRYPGRVLLWVQKRMGVKRCRGSGGILLHDVDARLIVAWRYMIQFCSVVNHAVKTQQKLSPTMLSETMTSVMYRLLHMVFRPVSLDEAIRLALLGLTYHVFSQWQNLRLPNSYVPPLYQSCLQKPVLAELTSASSHIVVLWLLMVGAVSIFIPAADYPWLKDRLRQQLNTCQIRSWDEVTEAFKSFLWIDVLHDKAGKEVFDSVFTCPTAAS